MISDEVRYFCDDHGRQQQFALIQTIGDIAPHRVKIGIVDNMARSLAGYPALGFTPRVLAEWPCPPDWVAAVVASVTRSGCRPLGGGLFECQDPDRLVNRATAFFALMPAYPSQR